MRNRSGGFLRSSPRAALRLHVGRIAAYRPRRHKYQEPQLSDGGSCRPSISDSPCSHDTGRSRGLEVSEVFDAFSCSHSSTPTFFRADTVCATPESVSTCH